MVPADPRAVRVLMVEDDERLVRSIAGALARAAPDLEVAARCGSCREVAAALDEGRAFDVALVDLRLPDGSGVDVIRLLRARAPDVAALVLTVVAEEAVVLDAVRAGAAGYLLKSAALDEIAAHVRDAALGRSPVSPEVARFVLEACRRGVALDGGAPVEITARERDVVAALSSGQTYDEVALALGITLSTVQTHVRSVYRKLGVRSKAELTAIAFRQGIVG